MIGSFTGCGVDTIPFGMVVLRGVELRVAACAHRCGIVTARGTFRNEC